MIVRSVAARHGRQALSRTAARPLCRFFASEVDHIEASAANSIRELQSIESQIHAHLARPASSIDPETPASVPNAQGSAAIAQQYHLYKEQQQRIGGLGSELTPHYQPHTLLNHPPSPADVTLELLLASEAHQGHATSLWNPANARYIHGIRQGIHIISLEATAAHLRRAAKVVQEVSRRAGLVLFVGTREGQATAVVRAAQLAKGYHLFERWIPGSITNGQQILGRLKTKVVNDKDEEIPGFDEQLYDRPVLRPDLVVCLNPLENYVLLHECALNNIPTIGIIDTNADPTWVTYPIPANDDSLRCVQVVAGVLGRAGEAGQKQRLELAEQGNRLPPYQAARGLRMPGEEELAQASAKTQENVLEGETIVDQDEVAAKLDAAQNHEGHKTGHRLRASS